jgi:hypothetical protein
MRAQIQNLKNEQFPFIRHDKEVRARVLHDCGDKLLIETVFGSNEPVKRFVSPEYFQDNFWEGVS